MGSLRVSALAKKMRAHAREKGYSITKNMELADALIAHSGGCFLLPSEGKAKQVLLIDPPFWPGRHPLRGLIPKIRREQKNFEWMIRSLYDFGYFMLKIPHWFRMDRAIRRGEIKHPHDARVVLVRNKEDDFTHPTEVIDYAIRRCWTLCSMVGQHDDLWIGPAKYLDLLDN